jgi:frataxin-like iron-binding protein CyaY
MIKLLSMFVRYAQLPEKEFARLAASEMFKLAEMAEKSKEENVEILAYEENLNVRCKGLEISLEASPTSRQLFYQSPSLAQVRFNYLGSRWVAKNGLQLHEVFEKDLGKLIKA